MGDTINAKCPHCGTKFSVPSKLAGRSGICTRCKRDFILGAIYDSSEVASRHAVEVSRVNSQAVDSDSDRLRNLALQLQHQSVQEGQRRKTALLIATSVLGTLLLVAAVWFAFNRGSKTPVKTIASNSETPISTSNVDLSAPNSKPNPSLNVKRTPVRNSSLRIVGKIDQMAVAMNQAANAISGKSPGKNVENQDIWLCKRISTAKSRMDLMKLQESFSTNFALCVGFANIISSNPESLGNLKDGFTIKTAEMLKGLEQAYPVLRKNLETARVTRTTTKEDGSFNFNELEPGEYIVILAPAFVVGKSISIETEDVEISLDFEEAVRNAKNQLKSVDR